MKSTNTFIPAQNIVDIFIDDEPIEQYELLQRINERFETAYRYDTQQYKFAKVLLNLKDRKRNCITSLEFRKEMFPLHPREDFYNLAGHFLLIKNKQYEREHMHPDMQHYPKIAGVIDNLNYRYNIDDEDKIWDWIDENLDYDFVYGVTTIQYSKADDVILRLGNRIDTKDFEKTYTALYDYDVLYVGTKQSVTNVTGEENITAELVEKIFAEEIYKYQRFATEMQFYVKDRLLENDDDDCEASISRYAYQSEGELEVLDYFKELSEKTGKFQIIIKDEVSK